MEEMHYIFIFLNKQSHYGFVFDKKKPQHILKLYIANQTHCFRCSIKLTGVYTTVFSQSEQMCLHLFSYFYKLKDITNQKEKIIIIKCSVILFKLLQVISKECNCNPHSYLPIGKIYFKFSASLTPYILVLTTSEQLCINCCIVSLSSEGFGSMLHRYPITFSGCFTKAIQQGDFLGLKCILQFINTIACELLEYNYI